MTMQSDTYEVHYRVKGEEPPRPLGMSDAQIALRQKPPEHTMAVNVWRAQKDTKDDVHRIKAIARALRASSEFEDVRVVKKSETTEEVSFQ